jgi:hypothetical protein
VVQFDKEASQTRDYWVAKNATLPRASLAQGRQLRAARPDSLGKLGTGSSLGKERLLRMTIKGWTWRFTIWSAVTMRIEEFVIV